MIIDFHTHVFPDALAERAVSKLSATSGIKNLTDGSLADTLGKMSAWDVDKMVCHHIATKANQESTINKWAITTASDHVIPFAALHWQSNQVLDCLDDIKKAGFSGIKLHPDYQGFMIDDKALYPIYERCGELGLIVMFHTGFDYISPKVIHAVPEASAKIIKHFPNCKFVLAHLGGFRLWDEVLSNLAGLDVYMDTAMCPENIDQDLMKRILSKHDPQRILFGSDCPWQSPQDNLRFLESLNLSEERLEMILHQNAEKLLAIV